MICTDRDTIERVLADPGVWSTGADDHILRGDRDAEIQAYVDSLCRAEPPGVYVLSPIDGMLLVGYRENLIAYWFHVYVVPAARKNSLEAGREALTWMWQNSPAMKIMGMTPDCLPHAMLWASSVGLRREGISRKSYMYRGKLRDRVIFGIEKDGG